jgi:signal peptidase I
MRRYLSPIIIVAAFLALYIVFPKPHYYLEAFRMSAGSMSPTVEIGDHVIVNRFIYGLEIPVVGKKILSFHRPARGDVIVFRYPPDPEKQFIKRVIGIPGDRIEIHNRKLAVNGVELPLREEGPYTLKSSDGDLENATIYAEEIGGRTHRVLQTKGFVPPLSEEFSTVVPEGKYFCMGDNRDYSNDSRYWGSVDLDLIRGKVILTYFSWPLNKGKNIFHQIN